MTDPKPESRGPRGLFPVVILVLLVGAVLAYLRSSDPEQLTGMVAVRPTVDRVFGVGEGSAVLLRLPTRDDSGAVRDAAERVTRSSCAAASSRC